MGHLNGPYYPHALIQGFAYAHITLFAYAHITIFDIPSVMHLRANYLAFYMYLAGTDLGGSVGGVCPPYFGSNLYFFNVKLLGLEGPDTNFAIARPPF